jgi:Tol biopolymer transport system component
VKKSNPRRAALPLLVAAVAFAGCDDKVAGTNDRTPPEASIDSPAADAIVSAVGFFVTVTATDDVAVDRVEISVDGGEPVVLTEPPYRAHLVSLGLAAGTPLAIQAEAFDAAGNSDARTVSVDVGTRTVTKLTTDLQDDSHPTWSPDGTQIAFQSDRSSGELNIWTMDASGANPAQLTANVNDDRHPAWSPDGDWIVFDSDRAGTFDIWRLPLASGEIDAENLTFGNDDDIEPAWSPGGDDLWFASSRGIETDYDVWRQDVATGVAVQVTSFSENERAPAPSADGTMLAFASELSFGLPHIYTMVVGGTEVTALDGDTGVTESDPAWAPAGSLIVFTRATGLDGNLWFKPVDPDVAPVQATFGTGATGDGGAAWHPDGDRVAFHSDRDGNLDIWVVE